jgi:hypothetical protein
MKLFSDAFRPASLAAALLLMAGSAAYADALPTPSMSGPLASNASPMSFDSGFGNIYVGGAISGLATFQSNHTESVGDHETFVDFTNAQVFIQKTDGWLQFYVQGGEYSLPSLGLPYVRATTNTSATFGVVPVAYLKIVPADNFSIEAGKLPTLIGAEYTFTFENLNIERGLLWNEEPAVSRGVQVNYTAGPLAFSVSLNDGAYSNKYNWISGSAAWTISPSDTVSFVGGGDMGKTTFSVVNSESVYNLIWTHTSGPWTFTPYIQYTHVPVISIYPSTDTWGGAILANYAFSPNWSLGGRIEYIKQTTGYDPALLGTNSSALSFTITPTYQYKLWFARMDLSYVTASHVNDIFSSQGSPGPGFGTNGTATGQFRAMLELGILF